MILKQNYKRPLKYIIGSLLTIVLIILLISKYIEFENFTTRPLSKTILRKKDQFDQFNNLNDDHDKTIFIYKVTNDVSKLWMMKLLDHTINEYNKDQFVIRYIEQLNDYDYVVNNESCLKNLVSTYEKDKIESIISKFMKDQRNYKVYFIDVNSIIISLKNDQENFKIITYNDIKDYNGNVIWSKDSYCPQIDVIPLSAKVPDINDKIVLQKLQQYFKL